ncbi:MAG TPA: hypothetical protein VMH79_04530 [Thermoanaerobaculia bacterium]|nr:hypothetical protein [Thermoanaerobaculia bacterium]
MPSRRALLVLLVFTVLAAPARAEGSAAAALLAAAEASASPALALPNASAPPAVVEPSPSEILGGLIKDGHLTVEADLHAGSVPAIPKYALETQGSPRTTIEAEAVDGTVTKMKFVVGNGKLVVRGSGLRPKVSIEELDFEAPQGITTMKFHGLGIWKPIVAIFGGIARSAVRKMEFHTDIPSVVRGEILGGKKTPSAPPAAGAPTPAPGTGAPAAPGPSMMDLVDEVRLYDLKVTAFPGRPMRLRPFVEFDTASHPVSGEAMVFSIDKGTFRPGRSGAPSFLEFSGHLDGEIENGVMEFEQNRSTIAHGRLTGAAFQLTTLEDGKVVSALQARELFFELSSGKFVVPGGLGVALDAGSTFDVRDIRVTTAGHFSGVAKLDLAGKTGELSRQGATISASNIRLKTSGLTVVDGRATGPLELTMDYQLQYPFVVKYPIKEVPEKRLDLDFHGPFAATLQLKDAGGSDGEVTGTYVFKAPWDPIEQAALLALEAKWQQDLAVKHVDFAIVPKMFRPCGETCFTLGLEVTAEKRSSANRLKKLFSQFCAPVGKANLVVDKAERAFLLEDVKIETHCKGVIGWVINFLTPFLTKTYSEMKLFQMPANLPLTVDSVRGGAHRVEIGGSIDWRAGQGKPEVPPKPQPVEVQPGT